MLSNWTGLTFRHLVKSSLNIDDKNLHADDFVMEFAERKLRY